jgi:hypothetical protein
MPGVVVKASSLIKLQTPNQNYRKALLLLQRSKPWPRYSQSCQACQGILLYAIASSVVA